MLRDATTRNGGAMSVLMMLSVSGDPKKLEEHAAGDPEGMADDPRIR
jgi:hypothetical protein